MELLDDEPARRHDLLYDVCSGILFGAICVLPVGLRFAQMAGRDFQNARDQFSGGVSPARRRFVVDFTVVSEKLGAIPGGFWLLMLQWIRLWSLLGDGTSRMVDQGLGEHGHLFINHRMLQVQSEYVIGGVD